MSAAAYNAAVDKAVGDLAVTIGRHSRLATLKEVREKVRRMPSHLLDTWFEKEIARLQQPDEAPGGSPGHDASGGVCAKCGASGYALEGPCPSPSEDEDIKRTVWFIKNPSCMGSISYIYGDGYAITALEDRLDMPWEQIVDIYYDPNFLQR